MPWTEADAERHQKKANTDEKRRIWARKANAMLDHGYDEGTAIRMANAAVRDHEDGRGDNHNQYKR